MNKKILCVGSLVVDIVNEPIPRTVDAVEGISTTFDAHLGGNAYNVAIDLQQLGWQADQIACLGAAGKDFFGEVFQQGLQKHGILSGVCLSPGIRTSKNLIFQVEGEEPQHHMEGTANRLLSLDFVLNWIQEFRPALFYIGEVGLLGETGKNLKLILETARETGCITVVDILYPPDGDVRYFVEAAPFIDVLHCNEDEARFLTGQTELQEIAEKMLELGIGLPLITLAEKGLVCAFGGTYHTLPAFKVTMIDPTGAGDAFTAGMIKKLLEFEGFSLQEKLGRTGEKLFEAVQYGMAAGASSVTALGCTQAVREASVLELLESGSIRRSASSGLFNLT